MLHEITQDELFNTAGVFARMVYRSIPETTRVLNSVEDLTQDFLLTFLEKKQTYDATRATEIRFIRMLFGTKADVLITTSWDRLQNPYGVSDVLETAIDAPEDGEVEVVRVTTETPLDVLLQVEEQSRMVSMVIVLKAEIERLCTRFNKPFVNESPIGSLMPVLKLTLGEMTDGEFAQLEPGLQDRLAQLGDAVRSRCISFDSGPTGFVISGLTGKIRELMDKGMVTRGEIQTYLDREGICYNPLSLAALVSNERKTRGLTTQRKRSVVRRVEELFQDGKGVTEIGDMVTQLQAEGYRFTISTVRNKLSSLRSVAGFRRGRPPAPDPTRVYLRVKLAGEGKNV